MQDFLILTGRCKDNFRIESKEIGYKTRNWIDSARNINYWSALVNAELNLRVSISHVVSWLVWLQLLKVELYE